MLELIIPILSIVASLSIGLFVFLRRPGHIVHRLYGLLSLSLILFSVSNLLAMGTVNRLLYIRLVMAFCTLMVVLFYYFLFLLENDKQRLSLTQKRGLVFTALVVLIDLTPFVFSSVPPEAGSAPDPNYGVVIFLVHFLLYLVLACVLLIHKMRNTHGDRKMQYAWILIGVLPVVLLAPITGFFIPVIFRQTDYIFLGPVYVLWFITALSFAVVRHGLFNIKLILARSVGYVLSVGILAALYGFIIFGLLTYLLGVSISVGGQLVIAVVIAFTAFLLDPIKQYFDRMTNRIFYRDSFDTRELLDSLGQVFISTVKLEELVHKTSKVIATTMKVEAVSVGVQNDRNYEHYAFPTHTQQPNLELIETLHQYAARKKQSVLLVDFLPDDQSRLREMCIQNDIHVFVRVTHDNKRHEGAIAFLLLSQKQSGNAYNSTDEGVLDTVAKELYVGIQNALQFRQIQRFNITLQQKVDDATRELRKTNDKLMALDEAKDDFISMASHQLRTPLTSIKGYISMILEGDAGAINDQQRTFLNQAFASSQRMVYLIADLLNVSRLKTGKFIIENAPTYLPDVVETEIGQLYETAAARGLELHYEKPATFSTLNLDETKIRQVIMNFADNAIYYTPKGGHIDVNLTETENSVEFLVKDDGIGVPKAEQHHLFTKFYRAGNARRARPDGTGLGLFMAKKVIVAQGGSIIFRSTEGKGSTFGFTLPKAKLAVPVVDEQSAIDKEQK